MNELNVSLRKVYEAIFLFTFSFFFHAKKKVQMIEKLFMIAKMLFNDGRTRPGCNWKTADYAGL